MIRIAIIPAVAMLYGSLALALEAEPDTRPGFAPDIRDDETSLKLQRGDFVIVPIPISNPTRISGFHWVRRSILVVDVYP